MFLSWVGPKVGDRHVEPAAHLAVGVLGEADRAGIGDPFEARRDVDAIAHQIAIAFLDDVAQMDANAKLDTALRRQAGVALDHASLNLDRAAHGVDHAAELDEAAVAGALDDAAVMQGDGRIDQIAAQRPEPRQSAILVRARQPAIANHVGDKNRRNFPGLHHSGPSKITGADVTQAPEAGERAASRGAREGLDRSKRPAGRAPVRRSLDRQHQVLVRAARPHHIGLVRIGLRVAWIGLE